jgi:hypothetical protein
MISELAATLFSLSILVSTSIFGPTNPGVTSWGSLVDYFLVIIYSISMTITESTGTGFTDKSRLQLCRQSRWLFLSRPLLFFRWCLPSQQGLCAQIKPSISGGGSLVDDFWVGSDSVFAFDFGVYWVSLGLRIQASPLEVVWLIISESSSTPFRWRLPSQQGLGAWTNPGFSCVGSLIDYFSVVRNSVFDDDNRVNRDCARRWNQASAVEEVSLMISESAATLFSLSILVSTSIFGLTNPGVTSWGSLVYYFWVVS